MEIERKFLVIDPPRLEGYAWVPIEQGYLALAGDEGGAEVRLRRRGDERWLTIKGGGGLTRTEEELALDRRRFDALWPLTRGQRLEKTRYLIPLGGDLIAELDVYEGALAGLVTAEVEFPTTQAAGLFEPPEWMGRELTGDPRFLNESLAVRGRPAER